MKNKLIGLLTITLSVALTSCEKEKDNNGGGDQAPKSIEVSAPSPLIQAGGFYVANEDWFGKDNGTVNYFKKDGIGYTPSYRIYRAANADEQLGTTTQFATVWGDYVYICSKQGNSRLVVAEAKTMIKKAVFKDLGGDGRSFVGIDNTKGYVGHSTGIVVFDIATLQLGEPIVGVSGQIGGMCEANGRVFAVSQTNGLYVINATTDMVEETISGSYSTLTRSKDGSVWVASTSKLIKLDPATLQTEEIDYPDGAALSDSWGYWNAGSLCASTQNNAIYWSKGANVIKYDIDTKTASTIFTLGKSEHDTQLAFCGAGLRVDPLTDELVLTVKHDGWGASGAYNWIYKLDAEGQQITYFAVKGDNGSGASWAGNAEDWDGKYFWFPAIPFFEDANKPQILLDKISLKPGQEIAIELDDMIVDYDNTITSIQKSVTFNDDNLVESSFNGKTLTITAGDAKGSSTFAITVISNGVLVNKSVGINVK